MLFFRKKELIYLFVCFQSLLSRLTPAILFDPSLYLGIDVLQSSLFVNAFRAKVVTPEQITEADQFLKMSIISVSKLSLPEA